MSASSRVTGESVEMAGQAVGEGEGGGGASVVGEGETSVVRLGWRGEQFLLFNLWLIKKRDNDALVQSSVGEGTLPRHCRISRSVSHVVLSPEFRYGCMQISSGHWFSSWEWPTEREREGGNGRS